jgi:hypothetical protein
MKHRHFLSAAVIGLGLGLGLVPAATPLIPPALAAENSVRPEVGKPLQAAQELIKAQKYRDALAKIHEAEEVGELTPFESGLVDQLRAGAAQGAGDFATAAKAYESLLAAGRGPAATDPLKVTQVITSLYFQAKDFGKAASWAKRYVADGGTDPNVRNLIAQAYYQGEDYPNAVKAVQDQIKAAEQAGQPVPEAPLQILLNSENKLDDKDGYGFALEKLVTYHPKPEYWESLLHRIGARQGFPDRLQLDLDRLAQSVGTLKTTAEVVEFAELALQAGLPGEAKAIIDKGYADGVLGTGADAERHKRLRDLATKKSEEDLKTLAVAEKDAAGQPDGTGLVNTGFDYVGYGQLAKGLPLLEQGIQKGSLKRPDEAKLHLGIAYLLAGQKDKAVATLKTVQSTDPTADLARLWIIKAKES